MTRQQLEHILRASAAITGVDSFVIIGSQAILGEYSNPPSELVESVEVDIFTFRSPEDAVLIDGSIGEESPFHQTFGYYAHGVGEETAMLPQGWKDRLVELRTPSTGGASGMCLDVHDLAVSKLAAGREKDLDFITALIKHKFIDLDVIESRLESTKMHEEIKRASLSRLRHLKG